LALHVDAARDAESRQETSMTALRAAIETAQLGETALGTRLTEARVELAGIAERAEAFGRELTRLDEMETDFAARIEQARQRQTQLGERRAWLVAERERTDGAARDVAVERDQRENEAREAGESHQLRLDEARALDEESRSVQGELNRLIAGIHEVELKA